MPNAARFQLQRLPARMRRGADEPDQRPAFADRLRPHLRPGPGQRFRLQIRHRHPRRTCGQHRLEQAQLGGAVGIQRAVIIQMIAREIGEARRRKPHAIQPKLVQPVRGRLDRCRGHAGPGQARQRLGQGHRIGRREAGSARAAGGDHAERAEARGLLPGGGQDLPQELGRAGLAVGAGDGDHGPGLRTGLQRSQPGQRLAGFGGGDDGDPGPSGAGRRQDRRRPLRHRVGDEGPPIHPRAGQRRIEHAGPDRAAIGGDAGEGRRQARWHIQAQRAQHLIGPQRRSPARPGPAASRVAHAPWVPGPPRYSRVPVAAAC